MISRIFFHELDRQYREIVLEILIGLRVEFLRGGENLKYYRFLENFSAFTID